MLTPSKMTKFALLSKLLLAVALFSVSTMRGEAVQFADGVSHQLRVQIVRQILENKLVTDVDINIFLPKATQNIVVNNSDSTVRYRVESRNARALTRRSLLPSSGTRQSGQNNQFYGGDFTHSGSTGGIRDDEGNLDPAGSAGNLFGGTETGGDYGFALIATDDSNTDGEIVFNLPIEDFRLIPPQPIENYLGSKELTYTVGAEVDLGLTPSISPASVESSARLPTVDGYFHRYGYTATLHYDGESIEVDLENGLTPLDPILPGMMLSENFFTNYDNDPVITDYECPAGEGGLTGCINGATEHELAENQKITEIIENGLEEKNTNIFLVGTPTSAPVDGPMVMTLTVYTSNKVDYDYVQAGDLVAPGNLSFDPTGLAATFREREHSVIFTVTLLAPKLPALVDNRALYPSTYTLADPRGADYALTLPQVVVPNGSAYTPREDGCLVFCGDDYLLTITYNLTGAGGQLVSDVLSGFSYDPETRIFSGYPTALGEASLVYRATDKYGNVLEEPFVAVATPPTDFNTEPVGAGFGLNREVDYTLPPADTGSPPFREHELLLAAGSAAGTVGQTFEQVFGGLTFDRATRIVSGTLTSAPNDNTLGEYVFTYSLTDAYGHRGSGLWRVQVVAEDDAEQFELGVPLVPEELRFTLTGDVAYTLPPGRGVNRGPWSYSLTGFDNSAYYPSGARKNSLLGLTFDADTRVLSGTVSFEYHPVESGAGVGYPTRAYGVRDNFRMAYTAIDRVGVTYVKNFLIAVKPRPAFVFLSHYIGDGGSFVTLPRRVDVLTENSIFRAVFDKLQLAREDHTGWGPFSYTLYKHDTLTYGVDRLSSGDYTLSNPCLPTCALPVVQGGDPPDGWENTPGWVGIEEVVGTDYQRVQYRNKVFGRAPHAVTFQSYTFAVTATDSNGVESLPSPVIVQSYPYLGFSDSIAKEMGLPWADYYPNQLFYPLSGSHDYTLPHARGGWEGGSQTIGYGLSARDGGALPPEFSFTGDRKLLWKSQNEEDGPRFMQTFVIRGTDAGGQSDTHTFTLAANGRPVLVPAPAMTFTAGQHRQVLLSITPGTGTAPFKAAALLEAPLPKGMRLDYESLFGVVGFLGRPTAEAVGDHLVTVEVTDYFGYSDKVTYEITIVPALRFATEVADLSYTVNVPASTTLPLIKETTGLAPYVYDLVDSSGSKFADGSTIAGLSFDVATRVLSGTPTQPNEAGTVLTYRAFDANGAPGVGGFLVHVFEQGAFAGMQDDLAFTVGADIGEITLPSAIGGAAPLRYSLALETPDDVTPPTPDGVTFDAAELLLTGVPTTPQAALSYTLSVVDANGAGGVLPPFAMRVYPPPSFAITENYGPFTFTAAAVHKAYTLPAVITDTGAPIVSYSFSGLRDELADAVVLDEEARSVGGAFAAPLDFTVQLHAIDANGVTALAPLSSFVMVDAVAFTRAKLAALSDIRYRVGDTVDLELPQAIGGAAPLTYSLVDSSGAAYVGQIDGLAFAAQTRKLHGATSAASVGVYGLTYIATDVNAGEAQSPMQLSVLEQVALPSPGDITYYSGAVAITTSLPPAINTIGVMSYRLRNLEDDRLELPPNFVFDGRANPPQLRGSTGDDFFGPRTYRYTAIDGYDGSTATVTFSLEINNRPHLFPRPDVTFTVGYARDVTLAKAVGGVGDLTYRLDAAGGLPNWLTYGASGASLAPFDFGNSESVPSAPQAATVVTYSVTDSNGSSTKVTFALLAVVPPSFASLQPDVTFTALFPVFPFTLPPAQDGAGELTYDIKPLLASGLLWRNSVRQVSGTPSQLPGDLDVAETEHSYTATDSNGASAALTFAVVIYRDVSVRPVKDMSFTASARTDKTLPDATNGYPPLSYAVVNIHAGDSMVPRAASSGASSASSGGGLAPRAVNPDEPSLLFDPNAKILTGNYDEEEIGPKPLVYRVTDAGGAAVDVSFTAHVMHPPTLAPNVVTFYVTKEELERGEPTLHALPKAVEGVGDYAYTADFAGSSSALTATTGSSSWLDFGGAGWAAGDAGQVVLTLARTAAPPVSATITESMLMSPPTVTFMYSVADANDVTYTTEFYVTVAQSTDTKRKFFDVNKRILSEAAGTIASNTLRAITNRISTARQALSIPSIGGGRPSVSIGGQGSLAEMLAVHSKPLVDDVIDPKQLLNGTRFDLPLGAPGLGVGGGGSGLFGGGGAASMWGATEFSRMSGNTREVKWDGDIQSLYLGADTRVGASGIAGVALAITNTDVDFEDIGFDTRAGSGKYDMDITALHPYISWRHDYIDTWASVGLGEGDLTITSDGVDYPTDVSLQTLALGGKGAYNIGGVRINFKGEVFSTSLELDETAQLAKQSISTGLTRVLGEWIGAPHSLANGAQLEPVYEFGWRYDYGDSELGAGFEKALGLRYTNKRLVGEARLHGAYNAGEFRQWGMYASIHRLPTADGRGLSVDISPSYGEETGGPESVWNGGGGVNLLQANTDRDYTLHFYSRVGYGLTNRRWRGLLTPFGEWTHDENNTYRFGVDWSPTDNFTLNLTGEYEERLDGDDESRIILQGASRL